MNFNEATELLKTARVHANGKKISNHTRLIPVDDGEIAIKLHETNIVIFYPDGTIRLDSGTWRTVTTKDRINTALAGTGLQITANKGMWYIGGSLFYDGMTVKDGIVQNPLAPEDMEVYKKKIDKLVKTYIDGFIEHIIKKGLEEPTDGDCWPCHMRAMDGRPDPMGIDHYLSHFDEKYYVPSLFYNAFMAKGYDNPQLVWNMMVNNVDFRKSEGRTILSKYFRARKLKLADELKRVALVEELRKQEEV